MRVPSHVYHYAPYASVSLTLSLLIYVVSFPLLLFLQCLRVFYYLRAGVYVRVWRIGMGFFL